MQLDFFSRLIAWAVTPAAPAEPPEKPAAAATSDELLTQQAQALLRGLGCARLAAEVQVRWNSRMRSTAGTAFPGRALVTLNPRLQQFGAEEVDRTLRHELAHLLAHHRAGRRRISAHGPEWRQACLDLGLVDEKRCHTLPLPQRRLPRRHRYRLPVMSRRNAKGAANSPPYRVPRLLPKAQPRTL
jgi:predicted SprT family Zn-dependent metalloprotease